LGITIGVLIGVGAGPISEAIIGAPFEQFDEDVIALGSADEWVFQELLGGGALE